MNAEILCIGTELLLGNILNTDANYIAKGLAACGISCYRQTVLGDNEKRVSQEIKNALERADILILTGGLGPTADDVTRLAVAKAFDLPLELDSGSVAHIESYFAKAGRALSGNNMTQAYFPKGAVVLENEWGTANAFTLEKDGKHLFVLPGPPRELSPMFDKYVAPTLERLSGQCFVKHQIHTFGIWESAVEEKVLEYTSYYTNPTVGIYASCGEVMLQITARAESREKAESLAAPVVRDICARLGDAVFGVDVDTLEGCVLELLKEKGLTLATAESCTGGLVAKRITDLSGSSSAFGFGFVTYANEAKINMLGVSEKTLGEHGAVSPETAIEMARGAREKSGADIAVALTGIAGPSGGTTEKPVGTVWVAVTSDFGESVNNIALYRPGADREYIRKYASSYALNEVRKMLTL